MNDRDRITTALLALRLGVFLVMLMWTLDKFLNVGHASRIFENFYSVSGLGQTVFASLGAPPRSFNALVLSPVSGSLQQPAVLRSLAHAGRLFRAVLFTRSGHEVDDRRWSVGRRSR